MANVFCTNCGNSISPQAVACPQCGHPNAANAQAPTSSNTAIYPGSPKNRVVAGVLAILLGGIGVHKFYLGKVGLGVLYLLFCWTAIPAFIALIEGIIYLVQSDQEFGQKQGVSVN
jgi:TM2 domain-containing membrane protein YozV